MTLEKATIDLMNNDILFPHSVILSLKNKRGKEWAQLVERISKLPENHEETLAFMLMMVRLNGCMTCETDSFRAMRGCTSCTHQTLKRLKDEDTELFDMYEKALSDVRRFHKNNTTWDIVNS